MSWIDVLWPVMNGASLTLAFIHFCVWLQQRALVAHLLIASIAVSAAWVGLLEHGMLRAIDTGEYARLMRQAHIPVFFLVAGVVLFTRVHFRTGRKGLGNLVIAARAATLVPNFLTGVNLNFEQITALQRIDLPWGEWAAAPIGTVNPWMLMPQLANVLLLLYLLDAVAGAWRRSDARARTRVLIVGGSLTAFLVVFWVWTAYVVAGAMNAPIIFNPVFMVVLLVLSYELGRDILGSMETAKKLAVAEAGLLESKRRMDLAVQAAGVGIFDWDRREGAPVVSNVGQALLGLAPGQAFDPDMFRLRVHPGDRPVVDALLGEVVMRRGEFRGEFRILDAGGHYRWIVSRGRVEYDPDGKPVRAHGVLVDVNDRKRTEERFQAVVEAAPNAMLVIDSGGTIVLANRQCEAVFGYAREELVGLAIERLVPATTWNEPRDGRSRYTSASDVHVMGVGRELFGRRKDGGKVPIEVALSPVRAEGEHQTVASVIDITERKRVERESALQREELAHLSRVALLAELSGSLAHELNQPLTAILSNAQAALRFMAHSPPNLGEVGESLVNIVESDKRAGEVIRRLRAMLRKEPMSLTRLDLNDVIQDVLRIIRSDLLNRRVDVRLELAPDLPDVDGDQVQLQQVLLNLIINGSDAMARLAGGRELTLRTVALPGGGIEVSVSDVGHGVPEADIERIFTPFVSTKPDGMGLGLAVCATIIQAHRGSIQAANNAGPGATVSFRLPAPGAA